MKATHLFTLPFLLAGLGLCNLSAKAQDFVDPDIEIMAEEESYEQPFTSDLEPEEVQASELNETTAEILDDGQETSNLEEQESVVLGFDPTTFPSVLFTYWERAAIQDAKNSEGSTINPTDAELEEDMEEGTIDEPIKPPPEKRYVTLNGIVYKGSMDWTIWLNGTRYKPDALPEEAMDLKVYKEYIEIKWFDEYTKRILPIRLRPRQRFNIDTRIFLPG